MKSTHEGNMKRSVFKLLVCVAACLVLAGAAFAQDATDMAPEVDVNSEFDLHSAVQRALEANPAIVAARAQLTGSQHGVKSARGDFLAPVSTSYGWEHQDRQPTARGYMVGDQDSWGFNLNLSQPLFTGFQLLSNYQKQKLSVDQSEATLYNAELQVISAVQSAFLGLLKARMQVKSDEDSVARLQSQLEVTKAFYEVGLKPRLDVLQAEVDLADAEQSLLTSKNTVSTTDAQLNTLLNLPVTADIKYVGELKQMPFDMELAECLKRAYDNRPDIMIGEKSVAISKKDADIVASDYYPDVSADYNYNRAGDDPVLGESDYLSHGSAENWNVGVNMTWKPFEWGSTYYAHNQALEGVKQLQAELEDTKLNAGFEVKQYRLALKAAADRIGVANKSVEAAQESYRMAVARYQAQVGTQTDVLDAQSRLTDAEASLINALADYETALSNLYVAMGEKNLDLGGD